MVVAASRLPLDAPAAASMSSTDRRRSHRLARASTTRALAHAVGAHLPEPLVWEWQQTASLSACRLGPPSGTRPHYRRSLRNAGSTVSYSENTRGRGRGTADPHAPGATHPLFGSLLPQAAPPAASLLQGMPPPARNPTRRSARISGPVELEPPADPPAHRTSRSGPNRTLRSNTSLADLTIGTLVGSFACTTGKRKRSSAKSATSTSAPVTEVVEQTSGTSVPGTAASWTTQPCGAHPTPPRSCPATPSFSQSPQLLIESPHLASPFRRQSAVPATPPPSVPRLVSHPTSDISRSPFRAGASLRLLVTPGATRVRDPALTALAGTWAEKGLRTPLSSSSPPSSRLQTPGSASTISSFSTPVLAGSPFAGDGSVNPAGPSTPIAKRPRVVHLSSLAGSSAGGSAGGGGDLSRRGLEAVESAWAEEDWGF